MSNPSKYARVLPYILTLAVIAFMTGAAELFGERELIFPEITAVAIGALIAPVQSWNTSKPRLFMSISFLAVIGVLIVKFVPLPLFVKIPLGFLCAAAGLTISKTGFVPMISACVLPIILTTESFVYVLSVMTMTGIILTCQLILEKKGLHAKREFILQPANRNTLIFWVKQTAVIALVCIIPVLSGEMFFIVPPLIVGYIEMSVPRSKLKKRYKTAIALIAAASCTGVFSRLFFTEFLGLPLTVAAIISAGTILFAVTKTRLYFPPCGAICTLPMLLPAEGLLWYPVETTAGFIIMTIISLTLFKEQADTGE